jgi:ABC-2 type transport system ATP-binding protein
VLTAAQEKTPAITVAHLCKTYRGGRVRAVNDISLEIASGEVFGLIGPNGAGKTSFLGCLLGLLRPDEGTVRFDLGAPDDLEVRRATGYLPERLVFDRWMTGREFVAYHHALAGLPQAERDRAVDAALTQVGLERAAWGVVTKKYSRGMLQRVGLAQAIVGAPRYLFLDEPSSGMDPAGVLLFRRILAELKASGMTIIFNSHQLDQMERVCDRVAFIRGGKLETIESMKESGQSRRELGVRWAAPGAGARVEAVSVTAELIGRVAQETGAGLVSFGEQQAQLSVADDACAARLLKALVEAGVPIIEAAPAAGRLEKLFSAELEGRSN